MKNLKQIKIAILEDSEYFNELMKKRILNYSEMLSYDLHKEYKIKINAYLSAQDCLHKIDPETDLVFADFFLEDKITAWDLLKAIQEKCHKCKIVIMSQNKNIGHLLNLVDDQKITFIYKDDDAYIKGYRVVFDIASKL